MFWWETCWDGEVVKEDEKENTEVQKELSCMAKFTLEGAKAVLLHSYACLVL